MRELYDRVVSRPGVPYHAVSLAFPKSSSIPINTLIRVLLLSLGLFCVNVFEAAAQNVTISKTEPTCQNKIDGSITLGGFVASTNYTLTASVPPPPSGTAPTNITSGMYTSNAGGQIVFSNATGFLVHQGTYAFTVAGATTQASPITLYDMNKILSVNSTNSCVSPILNPFHNNEARLTYPANSSYFSVATHPTYLDAVDFMIGPGLVNSGFVSGCVGFGIESSSWSTSTSHVAAHAAGDYLEFPISVGSLKYDMTDVSFIWNRSADGPKKWAVYVDGSLAASAPSDVPLGCSNVTASFIRTFLPNTNHVIRIVGYEANTTTGTLLVDEIVMTSNITYTFYTNPSLTTIALDASSNPAAGVQTFQVPAIGASPVYYIQGMADGGPCLSDTIHYTVSFATTPTPSIVSNPGLTICNGSSTTLAVSPLIAGETYLWSNGSTMSSISANAAGTYTVVVTNTSTGCTASATATVVVNTPTQATIAGPATGAICAGTMATLTASAGVSWSWSTGANTQSIMTGTANTYTVTVTDANSCTSSASYILGVNQNPIAVINPLATAICAGGSTTFTASGGSQFMWSNNANTPGILVSSAGTYTVTVTNLAGCTDTESATLTVNQLPTVGINSSVVSGAICNGSSITLIGTGANTYAWQPGNLSGPSITVTPAANTTYTVTGTDANGCTDTETYTVTVNNPPVIGFAGVTTICQGQSTTITATGGGAYAWSNGVNVAANPVSPAVTTTYTVTVTLGACSASSSVTVNVNVVPSPSIAGANAICFGATTILTASGGTGYQWSGGPNTATYSVSPASTTTYTVTVTGANGCTASASRSLIVHTLPLATIAPSSVDICIGTMTTLTAGGGTSYVWSNGINNAVNSVSPIVSTTYTVTATDANGCTDTESRLVSVLPLPTATINGATQVCQNGGPVSLTASGGSYLWNTGATTATIQAPAGAPSTSTVYIVTVTGANGCTNTASHTLTTNPNPVATIINNNPICMGSSLMLTAMPAPPNHTYLWSTNSTAQSISVAPAANANYAVTITNNFGCTNATTAMVTVLSVPTITFSGDNIICVGESTSISATTGAAGAGFVWNTGTNGNTINISPVATTTYTVTATAANGCTAVASHTVTVNALPIAAIAPTNAIVCTNSTLQLAASGGGTYQWSANAGSSTNATVTVNPITPAVTYTVTVTNTAGCTASASRLVNVATAPVASITPGNTSVCKGATVTLTANGAGVGGSYNWSNGATTAINDVTPGATTTYTVTVTTTDGCTDTESVIVETRPKPVASGVVTPPSCVNGTDGQINITVTSPEPVTFTWMTTNGSGIVQGNEDQLALTPGDYTVLIQNNFSCDLWLSFNVPVATANNDITPPSITCDSVTVFCPMAGLTPAQLVSYVPAFEPIVSDNCDPNPVLTVSSVTAPIDVACGATINGLNNISYAIDYTWSVKDNNNNSASCVSRVYFQRIDPDDIDYPTDKTYDCTNPTTGLGTSGVPTYAAFGQNWPLYPTAGFCEMNFDTLERRTRICDGSYKITRTWRLFDWCNTANNGDTDQLITVMDTNKPSFTCPANVTLNTDPLDCTRDYDLPNIMIDDACSRINSFSASWVAGGMSMMLPGTLTTFPGNNLWLPDTLGVMGVAMNLPVGNTSIVYTVHDDCNNVTTCSFVVTVVDQIPPTASCKSGFMQISLNSDIALIHASSLDNGSSDNCSPVYFKARRMDSNTCQANTQFYDRVQFCCSDKDDTITVILRVYDIPVPSGPVSLTFEEAHSNDCMTTVIIKDKLRPTCPAMPDVNVNCDNFDPTLWAYDTLIATDNCGPLSYTRSVNMSGFDAMCKKGTIIRTFTATDAGGLSCSATQRINISHVQDYWVKFPDDVLVNTCNGTVTPTPPVIYGETCELGGTSIVKEETIATSGTNCYEKIITWRVVNTCTWDPMAPCVQVPNPNPSMMMNDPANLPGPVVGPLGSVPPPTSIRLTPMAVAPTNFSMYWAADANCYEYKQRLKVTDAVAPVFSACATTPATIDDLTNNDPTLWNEMYWWDPLHQTHNLGEAAVPMTTSGSDACSGSAVSFSYQLFLDLDGNGTMETVVNSSNPPAPGTVNYNNANTPNFAGGVNRVFDHRIVPVSQKYNWAIEQLVISGVQTAKVRWNTNAAPNTFNDPQLPYGTHKVKWFLNDGCGNQSICEETFIVRDDKAPNMTIHSSISTNMMPTGMAMINLSSYLTKLSDNMSDSIQIEVGMSFGPQQSSMPRDANGNPITSLTATCANPGAPLGPFTVYIYALDLAGNLGVTTASWLVTGNCPLDPGNTPGQKVTVKGSIDAKDNLGNKQGVANTTIAISGTHPTQPAFAATLITDNSGVYDFGNTVPSGGDIMVTPKKDDDYLNGINVLDVLLMQRHILGLEPLNTPYKIVAADINKSGSITSSDIVELRKLILGASIKYPNNTSWRFIDKAHQFSNPFNPFADSFKEYLSWQNIQTNQDDACFAAVKVGDLNNSAVYNTLMQSDDRSAGALYLETSEQQVVAGEVVEVPFSLSEVVKGYQFTLNYEGLTLEEVIPTDTRLTEDHYAVHTQQQAITFATDAGKAGFTLRFKANRSGAISEMLQLNGRITPSIAATTADDRLRVEARFSGQKETQAGLTLYQNTPNPMRNSTVIGFNMPAAGEAKLTIVDVTGRTILVKEGQFAAGYNAFDVFQHELGASGVYFYTLRAAGQQATLRMVAE